MFSWTKNWTVEWAGHKIVVENRTSFFIFSKGRLFIDGIEIQQPKVPFFTTDASKAVAEDLQGSINENGRKVEIVAHLGSIHPGFKIGCLIYVDQELVGGDVDKQFAS